MESDENPIRRIRHSKDVKLCKGHKRLNEHDARF